MKRELFLSGIQTLSFSYKNATMFSSDWPKIKQSVCKTEFRVSQF